MLNKIKIIEFFGEPLNYGGQESFILNVYSKINKEKFEFTFITPFECTNQKLIQTIRDNGDHLIYDNKLFESNIRKKYIIDTARKYINNNYDIIHIHSGSIFTLYNVAKISKKAGIKKVITHSHATGINSFKYKIIKFLSDMSISKYVDVYLACSKLAGKWKYPKAILETNKFHVINNGIDSNRYKYDVEACKKIRKKKNIDEDSIVLLNVGRLSPEKNQMFILEVFKEIKNKFNNSYLFLIGDGDLKNKIINRIEELNLEDSVYLEGNVDNVYEYMSASNVFLFPSRYEGLGLVSIEAQANGLPVICSNNIPDEANISDIFFKITNDNSIEEWVNEICKTLNLSLNRKKYEKAIKNNNFDIYNTVNILEKIYTNN